MASSFIARCNARYCFDSYSRNLRWLLWDFGNAKHAHTQHYECWGSLLLLVVIPYRVFFIYDSQMASISLLESTSVHMIFELVVSRDLVYKSCMDWWGVCLPKVRLYRVCGHTCQRTNLTRNASVLQKVDLLGIKIRVFKTNNLRRGVLKFPIQVTR